MWVPTIFVGIWWAYEVLTLIVLNRFDYLTRVFMAIPFGILYQSLFAFILQLWIPWGTKLTLVIDISLGVFATICHFISRKRHPSLIISISYIDAASLAIFLLWILKRMDYINLNGEGLSGGACYSDHSFQFNLITSFAVGINRKRKSLFDIEFPISVGSKLAYPVLPNFYVAFLAASCNCNFRTAFRVTTFLVGLSWIYLLHQFVKLFTRSSIAAAVALPIWIFSGGLGWLEIFENGFFNYYSNPNYIHRWTRVKNVFWFQSIAHIFNPQRSATFVFPLCAIVYICLWEGTKKFDWRYFLVAAFAVGITPQTQVHAYVALALLSLSLAVTTFKFKYFLKLVGCWTLYGIVANVIAFPLLAPFAIRTVENKEFIIVNPVWKDPKFGQGGFFHIFWNALGCTGAISLIFGFATADLQQIRYYLATFPILLISSFIMFQPWELDNTKLLHDGWFPIACAFTANYYMKLLLKTKNLSFVTIIVTIYISSLLSGILSLYTTESFLVPFYSHYNKEAGDWVSENTPVHAIFHYHKHVLCPSSCFAGRVIFSGYPGWTSSHGAINDTRTKSLYMLDEGISYYEYQKYDISYAWKSEGQPPFADTVDFAELVLERGLHRLYKIVDPKDRMPMMSKKKEIENDKKKQKKKKKAKRTFNF
ncbi:hypothetical protein TVAG_311310 [Trichomonas vaginalis G3]|uniref:Mannosyltransferase n=1 Tax=Trichomonas vaginalis (strain ATCC PRA-98 / G3) TaxID=412133 RepID=A2FX57_TRIV3|nr:hypothetical protein TVAGG3_0244280 [Trichomonas vaginalis G3]EAX90503.1 hypothetical protein TVAG_311310 [Trichomonas vaginalis G3]KAI5553552.1 hypothetical protein TVAGG3_0244280 [Trichomonas vaginalis G3]|eukprot:XP_001303433.1 hypothetical protein [Trichomonas vaginalis G3]